MRRPSSRLASLVLVAIFCLAACGLNPTSSADFLTIYTSRPEIVAKGVIERFEAARPEYRGKVRMLTMGAAEVLERVRAEKGRPQGDVWWGGTEQQFEQGVDDDLLAPLPPATVARVPQESRGRSDLWLGEMRVAQIILYNHDMMSADQAPKDWDDLIDPKFHDQILIRDVAPSGTMRSVFSALIARSIRSTGSVEAGYKWLRALDANTKDYTPNPSDLYLRIQRQEAPISIWNLQDTLMQRKNGAPFTPVVPATGSPVLLDGVGKIKGAPNGAAADAFVGFLLEEPTQQRLAEESFQIPTVPLANQAEWLSKIGLEEMDVDWSAVSGSEQEWITYWSQNIKGSS